ncbi:MAG: acyl-CoA dehydrogenase family protein [FCB group bacterium]|jgi:alkylation response protein AidB-like acyl-CoA dehydrogenase
MFSTDLDEIHLQIMETAREFAKEEIAPSVIERDIKAEFACDIIKKLGELGFLGIMTPPEWGGSGLDALSYVIAIEEFAKVDASITIILSVQNSLIDWIIETYGSNEQKEKFLRPLAEGKMLGAFCLSEPEAGSDASQQSTSAVKEDNFWILNGTKNWISTGHNADVHIVFAQTNKELRHKGIGCFIVEKGTEGFVPLKKEDKMGIRSSDTCSISIDNVKIPENQIIGGIGDGYNIALKALNSGRIGIAAQAVGIAQGAFEIALKYAMERKTFGKAIIEHQMIQQKLAQMSAKIDAARMLVYKAAYLKDKHENYIQASSHAKLFSSSVAVEVTRDAIQILGGYGYVREYHVERMYRDAKITEIYEGTSEIQEIIIVRELMKKMG